MEVFFSDGDWSVAPIPYENAYAPEWSGIAHACGWFKKKHFTNGYQVNALERPICAKCHDEIPAALVGLWKMHNWDHIQAGEDVPYRFRYPQYFYAGKPLFYLQGQQITSAKLWAETPVGPPR